MTQGRPAVPARPDYTWYLRIPLAALRKLIAAELAEAARMAHERGLPCS